MIEAHVEDEPRVTLRRALIEQIDNTLVLALDNANELLANHLESLGETTIKNKMVANTYRDHVKDLQTIRVALSQFIRRGHP